LTSSRKNENKGFSFLNAPESKRIVAWEIEMEAQLRIRQEAEERNSAHQDLASWIDCVAAKGCNGVVQEKTEKASTVVTFDNSLCDNERVRGNNYFTKGMYQEAVECYSRCLGNKDALASPVVYSNRGKKCPCPCHKASAPFVCNHPLLFPLSHGILETKELDPS
jgi:hypothetical protein